jgi:hypothetical protein
MTIEVSKDHLQELVDLEDARLLGERGDRNTALSWYRRARELEAPEAQVLVRGLEVEKNQ